MAAVLLAVRFLLSIRDVGGPPSPISVVSAEIERSITTSPRYLSKPIRDIQPIADCVLADNPETPGQAPSYFGEFDRESRRIVRLEVPKPDGSTLHIEMLRSEEWLRNQIGFVVAENSDPSGERLGVSPPSEVQEPFPAESGQPNKEIRDRQTEISDFKSPPSDFPKTENLKPNTSGEAETIGTTSNHPFWSEDRQEFVQAGSLEIGERLQTLSGDVKVVQQKLPRPGPQPVFNLEVHDEHVYFVGEDGVLVHNSSEYVPRAISRRQGIVEIEGGNVCGFANAGEVSERAGNLANRLIDAGFDDVVVGIRGSAVSGVSSKGGLFRWFGKDASDVDFFISSNKLESMIAKRSLGLNEFSNGRLRPEVMRRLAPEIQDVLDTFGSNTSRQIGRGADAILLQGGLVRPSRNGDAIILRGR